MAKPMGNACTCGPANAGWMLVGAAVLGIGLWLLVWAVQMQWAGAEPRWWLLAFYYAVAVLVLGFGRMLKWKAMKCPVHGMC